MPSRYAKGRNLEYSVRRRLKRLGYVVFRCAGSRPVDLIAIKKGIILLVECKTGLNPYLPPKQMKNIFNMSKVVGATPVLVSRKKYWGTKQFEITEHGLEATGLKSLIQAEK